MSYFGEEAVKHYISGEKSIKGDRIDSSTCFCWLKSFEGMGCTLNGLGHLAF